MQQSQRSLLKDWVIGRAQKLGTGCRTLLGIHCRFAAALLSPRPRRFQACLCVLDHVAALELGKSGDDVKEQLAGGGVGVDALVQAAQFDTFVLEHLHGFGELPQASAPGVWP